MEDEPDSVAIDEYTHISSVKNGESTNLVTSELPRSWRSSPGSQKS